MAGQALAMAAATPDDLAAIAAGWQAWAAADDGWLSILHSQIVCRR